MHKEHVKCQNKNMEGRRRSASLATILYDIASLCHGGCHFCSGRQGLGMQLGLIKCQSTLMSSPSWCHAINIWFQQMKEGRGVKWGQLSGTAGGLIPWEVLISSSGTYQRGASSCLRLSSSFLPHPTPIIGAAMETALNGLCSSFTDESVLGTGQLWGWAESFLTITLPGEF